MLRTRVMPCLLLKGGGLVKTIKFKNEIYVGDPINAVRIYNQKEVDELVLIDIDATTKNKKIQFDRIEEIASECFMPICYGGGVRSIADYEQLFAIGIEKVSVSSALFSDPELIAEAVKRFGSQSVVFTIDVKQGWLTKKYSAYTNSGSKKEKTKVLDAVILAESLGVGEIIIYSIDRDGTWEGFDLDLIRDVSAQTNVPLVSVGGAGSMSDIKSVVEEAGATAVGLGSMAVFQGKGMGVLIKFPKNEDLEKLWDHE